jgi:membrane peptidoglycan carboxypeptidase
MRRILLACVVLSVLCACQSKSSGKAEVVDRLGNALVLDRPSIAAVEKRLAEELSARAGLSPKVLKDRSYRIRTTIDPTIQAAVATAVNRVPATKGRFVPAVLVISPKSGETLALWSTTNDILRVRRGSGSTLKLVELVAISRAGILPTDVIDGQSDCIFDTRDGRYDAADGAEVLGASPIWKMTARSINCAFARLAQRVGEPALARAVADLGLQPVDDLGPRFAVGANKVTMEELVSAIATLLGDGRTQQRHVIAGVEHNGISVRLTDLPTPPESVGEQDRTNALVSLRAVLDSGTARDSRLSDGRPAAGKTGTQPDNTDAWFVGGTPSVAAVVWLGNPKNPTDRMANVAEFGVAHVRGATLPAPIWRDVVEAAVGGTRQEPLPLVQELQQDSA